MFTLDNRFKRTALYYTFVTMFCVLFGAVYEIFSHGVFSYYMLYAFAFPLVLGVLPYLILSIIGTKAYPGLLAETLYPFGIAILTVGCLINGVLEIYGTTSALTIIYWIAGGAFLCAGVVTYLFQKPKKKICQS